MILEGESPGGFLQDRVSARTGCPGVAASSRVLHTRQDWLLATVVLQVASRSSLRELQLASRRATRALRSAGE
jgi:hypothetical protein